MVGAGSSDVPPWLWIVICCILISPVLYVCSGRGSGKQQLLSFSAARTRTPAPTTPSAPSTALDPLIASCVVVDIPPLENVTTTTQPMDYASAAPAGPAEQQSVSAVPESACAAAPPAKKARLEENTPFSIGVPEETSLKQGYTFALFPCTFSSLNPFGTVTSNTRSQTTLALTWV